MAANQTIIKAAGQRYTSVNPDYSGHLQGLDYITTALINALTAVNAFIKAVVI
jgi:hypothetical protein